MRSFKTRKERQYLVQRWTKDRIRDDKIQHSFGIRKKKYLKPDLENFVVCLWQNYRCFGYYILSMI